MINMETEDGDSLLFAVCREAKYNEWKKGYMKMADVLVKGGIDLTYCDKNGQTAYEYAKALEVEDIAAIIKP